MTYRLRLARCHASSNKCKHAYMWYLPILTGDPDMEPPPVRSPGLEAQYPDAHVVLWYIYSNQPFSCLLKWTTCPVKGWAIDLNWSSVTANACKHQRTIIRDHAWRLGRNSRLGLSNFVPKDPEGNKNFEFYMKEVPHVSNSGERKIHKYHILHEMQHRKL